MKQTENSLEYFIYFILPIIILMLGLVGNVFGIFLLSTSKQLTQIGPVNMYRYLLLVDCIFLIIFTANNYFLIGFSNGFSLLNAFTCKMYQFTVHITTTLSKFCLIYILIERFLAIQFPVESNCLRKQSYQLVYFIVVTVIDCLYFMPVPFFFTIQYQTQQLNSDNSTATYCNPTPDRKLTMQLLTFVSETAIPAVLIVLFTVVLIYIEKSAVNFLYSLAINGQK